MISAIKNAINQTKEICELYKISYYLFIDSLGCPSIFSEDEITGTQIKRKLGLDFRMFKFEYVKNRSVLIWRENNILWASTNHQNFKIQFSKKYGCKRLYRFGNKKSQKLNNLLKKIIH